MPAQARLVRETAPPRCGCRDDERPHDALHVRPPGSLYQASSRPFSGELPPIDYPGHFLVRRVTTAGTVRFKKRLVFVSHALTPHPIGLKEVDDGVWSIYFCQVLLARLDARDYEEPAHP